LIVDNGISLMSKGCGIRAVHEHLRADAHHELIDIFAGQIDVAERDLAALDHDDAAGVDLDRRHAVKHLFGRDEMFAPDVVGENERAAARGSPPARTDSILSTGLKPIFVTRRINEPFGTRAIRNDLNRFPGSSRHRTGR
jgi:hypothetical protein